MRPKLDEESRYRIIAMAAEQDNCGNWRYTYGELAAQFGVTKSYISKLAAALKRGRGQRNRQKIMRVPAEFMGLYNELMKKVRDKGEVTRIMIDHIAARRKKGTANEPTTV
jgi:hypothetical protein